MRHTSNQKYIYPWARKKSRKARLAAWLKAHKFVSILTGSIVASLVVCLATLLIALVLNKISEAVPTILWIGFAVAWTLFWACMIMYYIGPAMEQPIRQFTRGVTHLVSSTSSQMTKSIRNKFRK